MDSALIALRDIPGISVTELRQITDTRGAVLHMLRTDSPDFSSFGECYFSEVAPGAVKAWKRHTRQTQNLAVPIGRIRLVLIDSRTAETPIIREAQLGRPDAYARIGIPPSIWYGFATIGEKAALIANCADVPHDPSEGESRPLEDPPVPFDWASALR